MQTTARWPDQLDERKQAQNSALGVGDVLRREVVQVVLAGAAGPQLYRQDAAGAGGGGDGESATDGGFASCHKRFEDVCH